MAPRASSPLSLQETQGQKLRMPSRNARLEAMRLEQAKSVIKRMKQKRTREAISERLGRAKVDPPQEVPAPRSHSKKGKERASSNNISPLQLRDSNGVNMSSGKKRAKMTSRKRAAKEPALDDSVHRRRKVQRDSQCRRSSDEIAQCEEKLPLPSGTDKKLPKSHSDLKQYQEAGSHLLFYSPAPNDQAGSSASPSSAVKVEADLEGTPANSPLLCSFDHEAPRRFYSRESSLAEDDFFLSEEKSAKDSWYVTEDESFLPEEKSENVICDVTEAMHTLSTVSPSKTRVSKREKILKRLKAASNMFKGKRMKFNAPMSIKMRTNIVKKPLFQVTTDDVTKINRPSKEICKKSSLKNSPDLGVKSKFSVTTVPDSILAIVEDSNDEVSSNEGVEEMSPEIESGDGDFIDEVGEVSKSAHNNLSMIQFHFIDGQVILHMKHPSTFIFCGQVQAQMLKGAVEVLGYCLKPSCGSQTIFSPKGSSLLTLQTTVVEEENFTVPMIDINCTSLTALLQKGCKNDAFVLLTKVDDKLSLFLEQYMTVKLFPRPSSVQEEEPFQKASDKLQCLCYPPRGSNIYEKGDSWDELSREIMETKGCTVVCGGKGVGKSTMLRFLINRYINSGEQGVLLIDLDPGQAELTLPGCISLSVVREPLLGPNFTHLQEPEKCVYIGDVNVANCVTRFMDACLSIVKFWHSEEQWMSMPCIVNTMGFSKGLGVTIMVQMLSLLQPASVIQIHSKSKTRNYPENLTEEYVKRNCSNSPFSLQLRAHGHRLSLNNSLSYSLHHVESLAESNASQTKAWGLDAKFSREIVILSYLSKIVQPPYHSLLEVVPYCCPLDALYLSVCHEPVPPSVTVPAFNASLVALCEVNPDKGTVQTSGPGFPSIITGQFTANCHGFGIVRGIDMESKQLYLLSPVSPKVLSSVNCLVLGAVCIPPSIYLTPPKEPGPIPYVISSESQHAAKPSKRTFRFNRPSARSST